MKTIILLNGDIKSYDKIKSYIKNYDFVIACDGGLKHCKELGLMPNIILGDFDSIDDSLLTYYEDKSEIVKFSKDKDFTDGELGIIKAIEIGSESAILLGGFSDNGRFEHILANIFMLKALDDKNIECSMISEKCEVYYLTKEIRRKSDKKFISIIPLSDNVKIEKSEGLKYDITSDEFFFGSSRSISNEILNEDFYISLKNGKALVITSLD